MAKTRKPSPSGGVPATAASKIQLPKDALKRVRLGQSFAEYDLVRDEPSLFVVTEAVALAARDPSGSKCFFVGRRGTGKTATSYYLARERSQATVQLQPQIFELKSLELDTEQHRDTRQRPFRSLQLAFERTLMCEAVRQWLARKELTTSDLPSALNRERNLIENSTFDHRFLQCLKEQEACLAQDEPWIKLARRITQELPQAVGMLRGRNGPLEAVIVLDRIDEAWDGTEQAVLLLTALMHACIVVHSECKGIQPKIFLRENIFQRVREMDNEFARLETFVVSMDWSPEQLVELVERRLSLPFNTKLALRGPTWAYFFPGERSQDEVFSYCQHRPRDVLTYCSFAIEAAIGRGHDRISQEDLESAKKRFSDSRLKDLGDEYAENYPSINLVLSRFFGLGVEFTLNGVESFIKKLLVDDHVKKFCARWIFQYTDVEPFVHLLYNIGFFGIDDGSGPVYRTLGAKSSTPPALSSGTKIVIHASYAASLGLQSVVIGNLTDSTMLKASGVVEELPQALNIDSYKDRLFALQEDLKTLPLGDDSASHFEDIVGEAIQLCFFRSLANIAAQQQTSDKRVRRDWVGSNRAHYGFWDRMRTLYGAAQILWECKNYEDLSASDFNQFAAYITRPVGRLLICSYRGGEKTIYYEHIRRIVSSKGERAMILLLTDKDLLVFMRQAMNGKIKEDHLEEIHDRFCRQVS